MDDLFSYPPAGTAMGKTDTSAKAGEKIHPKAPNLRQRVRDLMADGRGRTADEISSALNKSILSIRPRVTELGNADEIIDSGTRRENSFGNSMIVWVKGGKANGTS